MEGVALLRALAEVHAFDAMPLPSQRTVNYVPFEELAAVPCKSTLRDAIQGTQRVSVIGPVGSGKSSLIQAVVEEIPEAAPLLVSAAYEQVATVRDPIEFAKHMIRQIVRWATAVGAMPESERQAALLDSSSLRQRRTMQTTETLGVKFALKWIEPSWSREIQQTLVDPDLERLGAEIVASLDRLIEFVHGRELRPVVIIDDSDRWLAATQSDREQLLEGFFRETCRMLAERNWSVVLAIHPEYCSAGGFRHASREGFVNQRLDLPSLPGPPAIRRLLDARVVGGCREALAPNIGGDASEVQSASTGVDDAFESGFDALLFDWYRGSDRTESVRSILNVVDQALSEAVARGDVRITNSALRETMLTLG